MGGKPYETLHILLDCSCDNGRLCHPIAAARGHVDGEPSPVFVTEIPQWYRDLRWISSAHEAGNLNGSVYGQGLQKICRNRRLGVRSLRGPQTWRRSVYEKLLPLPREDQASDLVFTRSAP